ncbi:hypothetical protein BDQ17DRAFT_1352282 [Cyathus striatus]|nr:hypothetical protein BDQ17DRAFT_1352282 [Cyathus striatus]
MSFEHASVTKGLMVTTALSSILAGVFDVKHYFHVQFSPHISRHHQYWRLAAHHLVFPNSSDLFLGELLLFNVGVPVERQFGSVKYASFAVVSLLMSTLLEFVALLLFHRVGLNYFALGPAALIFSILYQYSRIIPSTYKFRVFGLSLSNKSMFYFLALQMVISRLPGSAAVATIGILTGQIYRSDLANLKSYRLPPSVIRISSDYILPLLGSLRPPRRSNRALPEESRARTDSAAQNEEVITTASTTVSAAGNRDVDDMASSGGGTSIMREWVQGLTGRRDTAGIRVPTEAEITQVTSMFPSLDRDVVVGALQRSRNTEAAVETLLLSQR